MVVGSLWYINSMQHSNLCMMLDDPHRVNHPSKRVFERILEVKPTSILQQVIN